jgi:hypothetical protein
MFIENATIAMKTTTHLASTASTDARGLLPAFLSAIPSGLVQHI